MASSPGIGCQPSPGTGRLAASRASLHRRRAAIRGRGPQVIRQPARAWHDDDWGQPQRGHGRQDRVQAARRGGLPLTTAEAFWYILGCIPMGAMYLAKVPAKKALEAAGMAQMTAAEKSWYVLQCIPFGLGYFAKLPVKKALSEASLY